MNRHSIHPLIKTFRSKARFAALAAAGLLSACSIYESSGRKQLETNAYALAGVQLASCVDRPLPASTLPVYETEDAQVFIADPSAETLLVNLKAPALFSCTFSSEVPSLGVDQYTAGIELTLRKNHESK